MRTQHFRMEYGGHSHYVYAWLPAEAMSLKGVVQIAHGMAETAARYERFAAFLCERGYAVYANDHLGHGQTAGSPEAVGRYDGGGFESMAGFMGALTSRLHEQYGRDVPLFMFGHSMGSFLTQYYMGTYLAGHPEQVQGIVLSGSNGKEGAALHVAVRLAAAEAAIRGEHHRSTLLNGLTFGAFNRKCKPERTPFDWLSHDQAEVDAYMRDPYCGGVFTSGFFRDFFKGLLEIHRPRHVDRVPKELPLFIFSGDEDPVGAYGKGVLKLVEAYRQHGLKHVEMKLYPGGRHEMLNEVNRDEVMGDVAAWLESVRGRWGGKGA
ncbi:alpha/beta fold hydrolase [Paenibacillus whitsoniae]|uniref:Alpha/beta fold hydrolase n=1 Tax=Paenibacillus whitsoniae TaxID=2496558 RepID=A0A430JH39_9BACL|nr:alpha/beta fold hydrolase [Paenibacillus whitsoniae]RTE10320.1 alpha/beta fold hydrolase [Paenibacillus whitsoniae]